jgi:hypothetical protein
LYLILKQFLPLLSEHENADVRAGAAQVMKNWRALGCMPEELVRYYDTLCNDARGRVRKAAM